MKNNVIIEGNYAILPGGKAFVSNVSTDDGAKSKGVAPKDLTSYPWSPWGDDNIFPQNVLKDLENNSIILRAFEKRKAVHFGRGIIAYREVEDVTGGEKKRVKVEDPEIVEFFRLNRINFQWVDHIGSLELFANSWNEFILNKARNKINRVFFKDPAYCRLAKIDENSFRIPKLYYSAQWEYYPSLDSGTIVPIPMYDPSKYDGERYPESNFIYPSFYRSFNKSYYHMAVWNGIRASGWLDIANKVPRLKQAIMKNQMTIKYHIIIPNDYFELRYPSGDYTREKQEEERNKILEDVNNFLSDVENSGKSLVSYSFYNKYSQSLVGWEIKVIDNKLKDDAYLPDSEKANSEILFAVGVDPTLLGSGIPGGKLGAGSGSDKREAFWQLNAEMGIYRQVSLEPLYFIRDFNKWDPSIQFDYVTVDTSQTMNQNPTKTEKKIDQNAQ